MMKPSLQTKEATRSDDKRKPRVFFSQLSLHCQSQTEQNVVFHNRLFQALYFACLFSNSMWQISSIRIFGDGL